MDNLDDKIKTICEKFYEAVKEEFNLTSQVKFDELSQQQQKYYRQSAINILILDDNSWKYFNRNELDEN